MARERRGLQQLFAADRVTADLRPVFLAQRGRLVQQSRADRELAEIVELCGSARERPLGDSESKSVADGLGQPRYLADVCAQLRLMGIHERQQDLTDSLCEDEASTLLIFEPLLGEGQGSAGAVLERQHCDAERALDQLRLPHGQSLHDDSQARRELERRTLEEHGEGVRSEMVSAPGPGQAVPQIAEKCVSGRVAVARVVAPESVDVCEQEQARAFGGRRPFGCLQIAENVVPRPAPVGSAV